MGSLNFLQSLDNSVCSVYFPYMCDTLHRRLRCFSHTCICCSIVSNHVSLKLLDRQKHGFQLSRVYFLIYNFDFFQFMYRGSWLIGKKQGKHY